MGREIRRVPPNWAHPYNNTGRQLQPMFDETFEHAAAKWKAGFSAWDRGERSKYFKADDHPSDLQYWEYDGDPPDRRYYRPWKDGDATWFQVWETVSEGTPVTPPFETPAELIDYLVQHGDLRDQKRGYGGWSRENAEKFVNSGWAPSVIVTSGKVLTPRDGA